MSTKYILTFIIGYVSLINITCTAQNSYQIKCIDSKNKSPIENIIFQDKDKILAFSDNKGIARFKTNNSYIVLSHLSYTDTLINLNMKETTIRLNTNKTLLQETKIKGKYKPKKHFKNLLEHNIKESHKYDTSLYYYFEKHTKFIEENKTNYISGILSYNYKGYNNTSKDTFYLNKIFNYEKKISIDKKIIFLLSFFNSIDPTFGILNIKNPSTKGISAINQNYSNNFRIKHKENEYKISFHKKIISFESYSSPEIEHGFNSALWNYNRYVTYKSENHSLDSSYISYNYLTKIESDTILTQHIIILKQIDSIPQIDKKKALLPHQNNPSQLWEYFNSQ